MALSNGYVWLRRGHGVLCQHAPDGRWRGKNVVTWGLHLPATEEEAGFTFVNYRPEPTRDGYTLVVDLREPQDGVKRIEIADTISSYR